MMGLICIQALLEGRSVIPWTIVVIENGISFTVHVLAACRAPLHMCNTVHKMLEHTARPHVNCESG